MDLDFVPAMSSNYAHAEHVIAVAKAKLHVFCEKPLALTVADADHFLECISEGKASPNSLRSARHSLDVALAMGESARSGQVVQIT